MGPGSIVLDQSDCFALYCLYRRKPTQSLRSYVNKLYPIRGAIVSESIMSRWFNHAFQIRGGHCVPNLVPYNKFRPRNVEKAVNSLTAMGAHERPLFNERHGSVVSCQVFICSQSLIAC